MITKTCLNVLSFLGFFFLTTYQVQTGMWCLRYNFIMYRRAERFDLFERMDFGVSLSLFACRNTARVLSRDAAVENVAETPSAWDHVPLRTVSFSADGRAVLTGNLPYVEVPGLHVLSSFCCSLYLRAKRLFTFSEPATRPSTQNGLNPDLFKKKKVVVLMVVEVLEWLDNGTV